MTQKFRRIAINAKADLLVVTFVVHRRAVLFVVRIEAIGYAVAEVIVDVDATLLWNVDQFNSIRGFLFVQFLPLDGSMFRRVDIGGCIDLRRNCHCRNSIFFNLLNNFSKLCELNVIFGQLWLKYVQRWPKLAQISP